MGRSGRSGRSRSGEWGPSKSEREDAGTDEDSENDLSSTPIESIAENRRAENRRDTEGRPDNREYEKG